ncbi:MAG: large conductance mechanosensitive channel protein [Parcubacteria group bacterium Gr01-1014_70]|nr:MAG: large conductance mechanosensitive channel protein [Parcubacteria group bacterium Gr01-1014_70]
MIRDFASFLKEFNTIALAFGFVMGTASTALVNSLVKDLLMPVIQPLLFGGNWKEAVLHMGSIRVAYGSFLAELLNFIILALIIFFIAKKILKMEIKK